MLTIKLFDDSNKMSAQVVPLSVNIKLDLYVPAHSAVVILPYRKMESCAFVEIYDGDSLVFKGVVDDEIVIFNSFGKFLQYNLRSLMALLIDSEAQPCEFVRPTGDYLAKRFLNPLGIPHNADNTVCTENIISEKGMSEYAVLRKYCMNVNGCLPFISADGRFDFKGGFSGEEILFNKKLTPFTSWQRKHSRCGYISAVNMKHDGRGYISKAENPLTDNLNICRERYLDVSFGSAFNQNTADLILKNSNKNTLSAGIVCTGRVTDCLGTAARIDEEEFAEDVFTVFRIEYTYNSKKEDTELFFERRV